MEVRVLPLRLDAETAAAIDEAWRARWMNTRMESPRRALGHYLEHLGASEVAGVRPLLGGVVPASDEFPGSPSPNPATKAARSQMLALMVR